MIHCSFCGKSQMEVESVIGNPDRILVNVYICNECIDTCIDILNDKYDRATFYDDMAAALFPQEKKDA